MRCLDARRRAEQERGSVSVWLATASFVMIVLVGLAVDLGGQVHALQRARDVAAQAARAGSQEVLPGPAVLGAGARIDPQAAVTAARAYLDAAGVSGSVTLGAGDTLVVTTTDDYPTTFLSLIGISSLPVTGEGTARLVQAQNGVEQ